MYEGGGRYLTKDEILAMEPGREMDELIDKLILNGNNYRAKMLKWSRYLLKEFWDDPNSYYDEWHRSQEIGPWEYCGPHYSTDISAAWEVVKQFDNMTFRRMREADRHIRHFAYIWLSDTDDTHVMCKAETMPEAICKCALLAVLEGDG